MAANPHSKEGIPTKSYSAVVLNLDRDEYWKCLDESMEDAFKCEKLRCSFVKACPQQWVKYFDRRRDY
nr:cytochrome c oxidase assembly factor 6 homolog [Anolis sagrei ordinatus]